MMESKAAATATFEERFGDSIESLPLSEALARLHIEGVTGILHVEGACGLRSIVVLDGWLRSVRSTVAGEHLGDRLVESGQLGDIERGLLLLAQLGIKGRLLGGLIVDRKLLRVSEVEKAVSELSHSIIAEATLDETAKRRFEESRTLTWPATLPEGSTIGLIRQTVAAISEVGELDKRLAPLDRKVRRDSELSDSLWNQLSDHERQFLNEVDARRSLAELRRTTILAADDWLRSAYFCAALGLLEMIAAKQELEADEEIPAAGLGRLERSRTMLIPQTLIRRAQEAMVGPDDSKALDDLQLALGMDPSSVEGWLAVAQVWRSRGNHEKAELARQRADELLAVK